MLRDGDRAPRRWQLQRRRGINPGVRIHLLILFVCCVVDECSSHRPGCRQAIGVGGEENAAAAVASRPFGGKPHVIPGTIEAEHYDEGAAEVAYHDVDAKNHGARLRGETHVDIEARPDASGGHGIGWTKAGEWLVYTVDVKEAGIYTMEIPAASQKQRAASFISNSTASIGPGQSRAGHGFVAETSADYQRWNQTRAGVQSMRIVMDRDGQRNPLVISIYFVSNASNGCSALTLWQMRRRLSITHRAAPALRQRAAPTPGD